MFRIKPDVHCLYSLSEGRRYLYILVESRCARKDQDISSQYSIETCLMNVLEILLTQRAQHRRHINSLYCTVTLTLPPTPSTGYYHVYIYDCLFLLFPSLPGQAQTVNLIKHSVWSEYELWIEEQTNEVCNCVRKRKMRRREKTDSGTNSGIGSDHD